MRKTTSLILRSLAVVDLLGSTVEIPLAFSTMIVPAPVGHLHHLSLVQVVLGPCLFWGYITCFFLLSIDRNDALRKCSHRQEFLTTKRILVVLVLALAFGVGLAFFFVFKTERPNPLLPRQTEARVLTAVRGSLFLFFLLSVSTNIYYYIRIKKLVKEHSEITASESTSQEQRNQWQTKERNISWTITQVILVVCLSYVPYIIVSIIFTKAEIKSLNAIALCRSLTYLKYAANVFIFTRLDGKFATAFLDILRGIRSFNNKVDAHSLELGVNNAEEDNHNKSVSKNRQNCEPMVFSETLRQSLALGHETRTLFVSVKEKRTEKKTKTAKAEVALPVIMITSPTGKTTTLKGKKTHTQMRKNSFRQSKCRTPARERSKTV